jgi:hypothetical protein
MICKCIFALFIIPLGLLIQNYDHDQIEIIQNPNWEPQPKDFIELLPENLPSEYLKQEFLKSGELHNFSIYFEISPDVWIPW